MRDIGLFTKTEYVPASMPPPKKDTYGICYEQMSKLRFSWWASWLETDERGFTVKRESGPFANYHAACQFAGR
jgi:hypothetical protein